MKNYILIAGSREYTNYEELKGTLKGILKGYKDITIISGGAKGVDRLGERYAEEMGYEIEIYLPNYEKYSRAAPIIRNESMVKKADLIICFWDGKSKGTKSTINFAKKYNKEIIVKFI